jgi:hypothetical protein
MAEVFCEPDMSHLSGVSRFPQFCLPSPVEEPSDMPLSTVTFESGSAVSYPPGQCFKVSRSRLSICVPAPLDMISRNCLSTGTSLVTVTFQHGSRLSSTGSTASSGAPLSSFRVSFSLRRNVCECTPGRMQIVHEAGSAGNGEAGVRF